MPKEKRQLLGEREVFRVLALRYRSPSSVRAGRVTKEVIEGLRHWFPYSRWSVPQIRRFVLKAFNDPKVTRLLEAQICPPIDPDLGDALVKALRGLRFAFVVPSIADLDAAANERYLGIAAFHRLVPKMGDSVSVGVSGGLPVHAFLQQLDLTFVTGWRFFALNCQVSGQPIWTTGDILLGDFLARHWHNLVMPNAPKPQVFVEPTHLSPDDLDWALVSVMAPTEEMKRRGVVAGVLGYGFRGDGSLLLPAPLCPQIRSVPLALLQRMVSKGKGVVAFGTNADALLAFYRAQRSGGLMFNGIVTDDRCAVELLKKVNPTWKLTDVPQRQKWWAICQSFRAVHLRYGTAPNHLPNRAIAERLGLSRKQIPKLLKEGLRSDGEGSLVRLKVKSPSAELELEWELLKRWGLREVRIVPDFEDDEQGYAALGQAAAEFLEQLAEGRESVCVGISWGRSVLAMLDAFAEKMEKGMARGKKWTFVALVNVPPVHSPLLLGTAPQSLLGTLMLRFSAFSSSAQEEVGHSAIRCLTFRQGSPLPMLDAVFTGIGIFATGKLIADYARALGLEGTVKQWHGEMLFQFFDRNGRILPTPWGSTVQALPLKELQGMVAMGKPVVVMARGKEKAEVLKTAHKMRLFNCLIADRSLALALAH